jgi:hypothetical protein
MPPEKLAMTERTGELSKTNKELHAVHKELRHEKERLKLLLDLNNTIQPLASETSCRGHEE